VLSIPGVRLIAHVAGRYTHIAPWSQAFVIVMEDIAPAQNLIEPDDARKVFSAEPFDESFGADAVVVERACREVTRMHTQYLNDASLCHRPWLYSAEMRGTGGVVTSEWDMTVLFITSAWPKTRSQQASGCWPSTPWPATFVRRASLARLPPGADATVPCLPLHEKD
jgi:hypothetical protein